MRILFISHTMPGVFGPLAEYFAAQSGNEVVFAAEYSRRSLELPGVRRLRAQDAGKTRGSGFGRGAAGRCRPGTATGLPARRCHA